MKRLLLLIPALLCAVWLPAQEQADPLRQASGMRANEKIYVVVAVLAVILAGFLFYLIRLDRKISRLEKGR